MATGSLHLWDSSLAGAFINYMQQNDFKKIITKVGIVTIIWNTILSLGKFIVGLLAKSSSMISDSIHSASDIMTTVIVIIGAKIASKDSDDAHEYGHERFEPIASIFLAVLLAITAIGVGYSGMKNIINQSYKDHSSNNFTLLALFGAIASIIIKGLMFIYTINAAKRIKSTSLKADAWHHLSDCLSSFGSLLGVVGLMIGKGWQILDPIAAIVICLIILKVAFDITKEAINQLVDKSIPKQLEEEIIEVINHYHGVKSICAFKSRQFSNKMYIDIEIYVDERLSLLEADKISKGLHDCLEQRYPSLKHCTIWAKPFIK